MKQTDRLPELLLRQAYPFKSSDKKPGRTVYMGGSQFGARAYADNLSGDNLKDALHYAHFYGKKLYLTVNTLVKERSWKKNYILSFPT